LRKDEQQLRKEIELEDDNTAVPRNHVDDEYAHAGEADPKVLLTTSRDPSSRLIQFAKVKEGTGPYIRGGSAQHSTAQHGVRYTIGQHGVTSGVSAPINQGADLARKCV
jgi:hypothetical protein